MCVYIYIHMCLMCHHIHRLNPSFGPGEVSNRDAPIPRNPNDLVFKPKNPRTLLSCFGLNT